ncbi:MAG: hypothetical protein JWQ57_4639 [Mucilaginibacter sp.]|nr:hypothetical protein [Mucilaginibacter sp.]
MLKNALVFRGVFFCMILSKQFLSVLLNVISNKI